MILMIRKLTMEPTPTPPKKFNLTDQEKDLKLYMFTVQKGPHINIALNEDFRVIMAYNYDDAIVEIRRFYNQATPIIISKRLELDLKKVLSTLNLEKTETS